MAQIVHLDIPFKIATSRLKPVEKPIPEAFGPEARIPLGQNFVLAVRLSERFIALSTGYMESGKFVTNMGPMAHALGADVPERELVMPHAECPLPALIGKLRAMTHYEAPRSKAINQPQHRLRA